MKTFINENGNQFSYDESETQTVMDKTSGNVVVFSNDDVIRFITETGLWDGYHRPFQILSIKKWIQYMKMTSPMSDRIKQFTTVDGSKFKTDYEIATGIREALDNNSNLNVLTH